MSTNRNKLELKSGGSTLKKVKGAAGEGLKKASGAYSSKKNKLNEERKDFRGRVSNKLEGAPINDNIKIDNKQAFLISSFAFLLLSYFLIGYFKNLLVILKNYYHKNLLINDVFNIEKSDTNQYDKDNLYYDSNRNEILKSIQNMKNNHSDEFIKLKKFKQEMNNEYKAKNKETRLDTNFYSEVNSKVLSSKNDNYIYQNPTSIFGFIFEIFQPTKA